MANKDQTTIDGFGDEWTRLDQTGMTATEHKMLFEKYFGIFPWGKLPENAEGFDLGCGSGRWAKLVAPHVSKLHCIDPSAALDVAKRALKDYDNCTFHQATVDAIPFEDSSMDYGYSLGVLHHVPDTVEGLKSCTRKLKKGAPFLVYLYYAFDNRPAWFRALWRCSDVMRRVICQMPHAMRYVVSQIIAALIYWPLARVAWVAEKCGAKVSVFPLSSYRDCTYYVMRTDALDRFGTKLEQRFTRAQIKRMMEDASLEQITFSNEEPFWVAVGYKKG